ncbi:MAG: SRPBCC domain-containing protein [Bacteroidota bacterium]
MKTSDNPTSEKTVIINRVFVTPLETLWKAWTHADAMKHWWGPKMYTCPYFSIDFRVGGKYLGCMKDHNHNETWGTGVYKEIEEGRKIVFTDNFSDNMGNIITPEEAGMPGNWSGEMIVTLEFDENYGKTDFTLKHEGIPADMHDDCTKGWQESLDKLEAYLKSEHVQEHKHK